MVRLARDEKNLLKTWGHDKADLEQIARAIECTVYTVNGRSITTEEAVSILGRKEFLSGISRSAFHCTAARKSEDNIEVYFDSSKLFR